MNEQRLPFSTPGQQLDGDLTVALRLLPEARKLLFHVRAIASNAGVSVFSMRRVLPDGSTIAASVHGPIDRVHVYGGPEKSSGQSQRDEPVVLPFSGYWGTIFEGSSITAATTKHPFVINPALTRIAYLGTTLDDIPLDVQVLGREVWHRNIYSQTLMPSVLLTPGGPAVPVGTGSVQERLTKDGSPQLYGENSVTIAITSVEANLDGTLQHADFTRTARNTTFTFGYDYFTRKFTVYQLDTLSGRTGFYSEGGGSSLNPGATGYANIDIYDVPGDGGSLAFRVSGPQFGTDYGVDIAEWFATAGVLVTRPLESSNLETYYFNRYKTRYFHRYGNGFVPGPFVPIAKMYAYGSTTPLGEIKLPDHPFFAANPIPTMFALPSTGKWAYYPDFEKTLFVWYDTSDNLVTLGLLRHGQSTFEKIVTLADLVASGPPVPSGVAALPIDATAWIVDGINPKSIK